MEFPSKVVEKAVEQISSLPGIGKKTALRLALHLIGEDQEQVMELANALRSLKEEVQFCQICHSLSDAPTCRICQDPQRDSRLICAVADTRDVLAIENTAQYHGRYHVLGGVISPMKGIGPEDLEVDALFQRLRSTETPVDEVIFALPADMEGDTTAFYLARHIKELGIRTSTISRGISVGSELEYTDQITLGRSILSRTPNE